MKSRQFQPKNIVPKIHKKKRKWRQIIEMSFVAAVVVGSLASFLQFRELSVDQTIAKLKEVLSVRRDVPAQNTNASLEEQIKKIFDKKILNITSVDHSNEDFVTIKSKEKTTVVLSTAKNLEEQAKTLQNVLAKAKIERKSVSLVDFRFEKLVVRY